MNKIFRIGLLMLILAASLPAEELPSPEKYFGFKMGTDRKLIDWEQIRNYFMLLDQTSDNIITEELGKTTLGRPFIISYISSAENLKDLQKYKDIQYRLAHPYDISPSQADSLIDVGKLIFMISLNIHSTEIGSSQESVELAYELVSQSDQSTKEILDEIIIILIPSLNPDGQQMITDWYKRHKETEFEGSRMPGLYHHYAGHDNNRDWFLFNLKESQLTAPVLYQEWFPEIIYDQHQMGQRGPRMFLPPYKDPVNPNVPSLLLSEVNTLGKYVTSELHEKGFTGIVNGMMFNSYFEGTMSKTPLWHNMIGILSELASARIASPLYLPRGSLGKYGAEISRYSRTSSFLKPWDGGWWRLRDIIEYEKAASYAMLDFALQNKTKIKKNFFTLNKAGIHKGSTEPPYHVIIPAKQHDPNSAAMLLERLHLAGVDIFKSQEAFEYDGKKYAGGSYIIPLAQPIRPYIKDLFELQKYPNLHDYPDGPPTAPYDFTGWTLPLQMGVDALLTEKPVKAEYEKTDIFSFVENLNKIEESQYYLIEARYNNTYAIINDLFKNGTEVLRSSEDFNDGAIKAGTFIIPNGPGLNEKLSQLSKKYQVPIRGTDEESKAAGWKMDKPKLAIYQPWRGNSDEGWTRLVLDNFKFDYSIIHNKDVIKGKLSSKYDVIILPSMSVTAIMEAKRNKDDEPLIGSAPMPEKYRGGIGKEGLKAINDFIKSGGTLVTLGKSCDFAIEKLRIPAVNVMKKKTKKEYFSPGSMLEIHLDQSHPIAYGMRKTAAVRSTTSPVFRLLLHNQESRAVGYFDEDNPLLSGWLIGAPYLAGKTALAEIPTEKGRVIMFGFRVQSRSQTYGTFKLLFNAVLSSAMKKASL